MKNYKDFLFGICISAVFIVGFLIGKNDTTQPVVKQQKSSVETKLNTKYQTILNIEKNDFEGRELYGKKPRKGRNVDNYSDEEIKIMREMQSYKNNGGYIYTPARVVPSD